MCAPVCVFVYVANKVDSTLSYCLIKDSYSVFFCLCSLILIPSPALISSVPLLLGEKGKGGEKRVGGC